MAIGATLRRHRVLRGQRPGARPLVARLSPQRQQHDAEREDDDQPREAPALRAQAALRPARRHRAAARSVGVRAGLAGGAERNGARAHPAIAFPGGEALAGGATLTLFSGPENTRTPLRHVPASPLVLRTVVELAIMDDALEQPAHGERDYSRCE